MTTPSNNKAMIINTRERAVSSDINRLQSFGGWAAAEEAKHLLLALATEETSGGTETIVSSITTPLTGIMLGGLVKPQPAASTDLFIDPSVAWVVFPDAAPSADDSPVKLVVDPGVSAPGVLTLTPGDPVLTRIDVVEVQPVVTVIETSNRDIFNPATGLFAAAVVNKVQALRWSYRIRLGTPGAGMPANALGWLPLMVAKVPALAASWDDCTFLWDVRPLLADREQEVDLRCSQPEPIQLEVAAGYQYEVNPKGTSGFLNGRMEWRYKGARAGGLLPVLGFDLSTNDNAAPGFLAGIVANTQWHLYAAFPNGLPRWARYTPVSGLTQRVPTGFRGVSCASAIQPADFTRVPSAALTLPSNTGLGITTTDAVAVFSGYAGSGGAKLAQQTASRGWVDLPRGGNTLYTPAVGAGALGADGVTGVYQFDVVEGTHVPFGTREVEFLIVLNATAAAAGIVDHDIILGARLNIQSVAANTFGTADQSEAVSGSNSSRQQYTAAAAVPYQVQCQNVRFTLPPTYPGDSSPWAPRVWHFAIVVVAPDANNNLLAATPGARITGYRL